jgi:hypothetical protein
MDNLQLKVNIDFGQLVEVINQLAPSQKAEINALMWNENMDVPIEHQRLVLDRIEKSKENPSRLIDWDVASQMLKP